MKTLKKVALILSVLLCFLLGGCAGAQGSLQRTGQEQPLTLQTGENGEIDYEALTNYVTRVSMKGLVQVRGTGGLGSGVIYASHEGEYYVLTNNHVVYDTNLLGGGFTITDCYGKKYDGEFLYSQAAYDLAILKFTRGRDELNTLSFAQENPTVGQKVLCLGYPYGQANAITYGQVTKYRSGFIPGNPASSILFACIEHDAWMATGSSGGILMNSSCELVGVNFAIVPSAITGEFKRGMTIPVEKVTEFLTVSGYKF